MASGCAPLLKAREQHRQEAPDPDTFVPINYGAQPSFLMSLYIHTHRRIGHDCFCRFSVVLKVVELEIEEKRKKKRQK